MKETQHFRAHRVEVALEPLLTGKSLKSRRMNKKSSESRRSAHTTPYINFSARLWRAEFMVDVGIRAAHDDTRVGMPTRVDDGLHSRIR